MNSSSDVHRSTRKRRRQHKDERFLEKSKKSRKKVKRRSRSRKRRPSTSSRSSSFSTERGGRYCIKRTGNSERLRRETPRRTFLASRSGERSPRGTPRKRSRHNDSNLDRNRYDLVSESSISLHGTPEEQISRSPSPDETETHAHETTQTDKNHIVVEKIDKPGLVEADNADPLLSQLDHEARIISNKLPESSECGFSGNWFGLNPNIKFRKSQ